ncbi:MAG: hypothetical protein K6C95_11135 [Lachnospiraceae bacterium]|nr:hypothetical protein [Lachnospiraceae bacterium]
MKVKASKKTILSIAVAVTLILLFFVITTAVKVAGARDYVTSGAVITDVKRGDSYTNYSDIQYSKVWYVEFTYEADGIKHDGKFRTLLPFLYRGGSSMTIRYAPGDPELVFDRFAVESAAFMSVFFCAFLTVLILLYRKADA